MSVLPQGDHHTCEIIDGVDIGQAIEIDRDIEMILYFQHELHHLERVQLQLCHHVGVCCDGTLAAGRIRPITFKVFRQDFSQFTADRFR